MFRLFLLTIVFVFSCSNDKNKPDVSDIKIDLQVQRFEKDFFKIDTNNISLELGQLQKAYPTFLPIYMQSVSLHRQQCILYQTACSIGGSNLHNVPVTLIQREILS